MKNEIQKTQAINLKVSYLLRSFDCIVLETHFLTMGIYFNLRRGYNKLCVVIRRPTTRIICHMLVISAKHKKGELTKLSVEIELSAIQHFSYRFVRLELG